VFLCDDGLYVVGQDGALKNLTVDQIGNIAALNAAYSCATVNQEGKYLAFGNALALEYDFKVKGLLKRSVFGIAGACVWNGVDYFAAGQSIVKDGTASDAGSIPCSMTLPYSNLGAPGTKSFEALYFTGTIGGEVLITATDRNGEYWEKAVDDIGTVTGYRIKTPKGILGNHVSFKIECSSGAFRMEELRCIMAAGKRSK
jgi:hypothetical protein